MRTAAGTPVADRARAITFRTVLTDQFDAVIHIDEMRAAASLERTAGGETGEPPETDPWAI